MTRVTEPAGAPPHPYPGHWEADVLAADGGVVHLRPISPDDADRIVALHSRLSERTRYLRYFGAYPQIPPRDLERFVNVDHHDRVALVAELGDDLVAIGRYDRAPEEGAAAGTDAAEVAFVVEDAHQGRGIGSVLLEHLAAAARERGVQEFVAYVLAENPTMVRIFLDAGYQVQREYESGLVHLSFPIEPTEQSVAVTYEREQRAEARSVERLLTPRSVAVIGASGDPRKIGQVVFRNLLDFGPCGPVYPVNPDARHVGGVRAYPTVLDVPDDIDLAVVAVPATAVPGVVEQCAAKRVRALVVVSGGFGERDEAGRLAERELVAAARGHGMRVVGPNCLGVLNTDDAVRLNATLAPLGRGALGRGRVGFFCQSGALGIAILAEAVRRELGLTTFVSAGNRADVSGNDLLQYWATDRNTEVVLLWLETFGNPRKFARLARRLARSKPIVAVKSGRYGTVPQALAGYAPPVPEERVPALFEASGVIRVETVTQLFDVAQLLAYQPLPTGRRVAVVANSSALGALAADACLAHGLALADPAGPEPGSPEPGSPEPEGSGPEPAAGSAMPAGVHSIGAEATAEEFAEALRTVTGDPRVDALVVVFVPPLASTGEDVARVLATRIAGWDRPVVSTFLAMDGVPEQLRLVGPDGTVARGSVPSYPSPERAVLALAHAARYAEWRRQPAGTVPHLSGVDEPAARAVVDEVLAGQPGGRELTAGEVARLLAAYGMPVDATGATGAPDRDGPAPDPVTPEGVSCVVGVLDDPSFGALVSFGVAGLAADLLGDRAYAAVPLTDEQARALVRAPRAAPLLAGYRGAPPVDAGALQDLLLRVARLADDLPEVLAAELSPVLAGAAGATVRAARVRVGPPTSRVPVGPRRLR
jgi:acyl-CoA synthetase (NDP forming)/GNAT superfamily N-acetyltransferase